MAEWSAEGRTSRRYLANDKVQGRQGARSEAPSKRRRMEPSSPTQGSGNRDDVRGRDSDATRERHRRPGGLRGFASRASSVSAHVKFRSPLVSLSPLSRHDFPYQIHSHQYHSPPSEHGRYTQPLQRQSLPQPPPYLLPYPPTHYQRLGGALGDLEYDHSHQQLDSRDFIQSAIQRRLLGQEGRGAYLDLQHHPGDSAAWSFYPPSSHLSSWPNPHLQHQGRLSEQARLDPSTRSRSQLRLARPEFPFPPATRASTETHAMTLPHKRTGDQPLPPAKRWSQGDGNHPRPSPSDFGDGLSNSSDFTRFGPLSEPREAGLTSTTTTRENIRSPPTIPDLMKIKQEAFEKYTTADVDHLASRSSRASLLGSPSSPILIDDSDEEIAAPTRKTTGRGVSSFFDSSPTSSDQSSEDFTSIMRAKAASSAKLLSLNDPGSSPYGTSPTPQHRNLIDYALVRQREKYGSGPIQLPPIPTSSPKPPIHKPIFGIPSSVSTERKLPGRTSRLPTDSPARRAMENAAYRAGFVNPLQSPKVSEPVSRSSTRNQLSFLTATDQSTTVEAEDRTPWTWIESDTTTNQAHCNPEVPRISPRTEFNSTVLNSPSNLFGYQRLDSGPTRATPSEPTVNSIPPIGQTSEEIKEIEDLRVRVELGRQKVKEREARKKAIEEEAKYQREQRALTAASNATDANASSATVSSAPANLDQEQHRLTQADARVRAIFGSMQPPSRGMGAISAAEAAALMGARSGGALDRLASTNGNSTSQDENQTPSANSSPALRPWKQDTWRPKEVNPVISPEKVTDDDWLVFRLHNRGWSYKEIHQQWDKLSPKQRKSQDWFRKRYMRMKATYPHLVPEDAPIQDKPQSNASLRNKEIEERLARNEDVQDLLVGPELDARTAQRRRDALEKRVERAHPSTGGKSISKDLAEYIMAQLEIPDEEDEEMDPDVRAQRAVTPPREDDFIFYNYSVERRTIFNDQSPEPWLTRGDAYEDLTEANVAATKELFSELDTRISPFNTWTHTNSADGLGMSECFGVGDAGRVEVRVTRVCRTTDDPRVTPRGKQRWVRKQLWDVWTSKTVVEETTRWIDEEVDDDAEEPAVTARDEQDVDDADLDSLFGEDDSKLSTPSQSFHGQETPTPPQSVHASQAKKKAIRRKVTSVVRKTIESPLDDVYGCRERANDRAARHYLTLLRQLDPSRLRAAMSMDEAERQRCESEEMDRHLAALDEREEAFDQVVRDGGVFAGGDGDGEDAEDDGGDGWEGTRIWVVARTLQNPRNL